MFFVYSPYKAAMNALAMVLALSGDFLAYLSSEEGPGRRARARIAARVHRLIAGNPGDVKPPPGRRE